MGSALSPSGICTCKSHLLRACTAALQFELDSFRSNPSGQRHLSRGRLIFAFLKLQKLSEADVNSILYTRVKVVMTMCIFMPLKQLASNKVGDFVPHFTLVAIPVIPRLTNLPVFAVCGASCGSIQSVHSDVKFSRTENFFPVRKVVFLWSSVKWSSTLQIFEPNSVFLVYRSFDQVPSGRTY